ncbi:MAG: helix-turn-helix transcriptional regulator [Candidatus Electryonea clarkiae]|nr:helix-turn-helix transcriptional regulator [Candidatus Electryonea clarkiae]MDP8285939.1 helix-turn-helix transcriptional regulator [Candidatus Electryonea clarkiae]
MDNFRREMKRGTIELILLKLLDSEDMYGYQLVASLEERGGEMLKVKEGTLYPVLYRLEDNGFIESYRDIPKRGVPRKYYKLTKSGDKHLSELLDEWKNFTALINDLTGIREDKNE